MNVFVTSILGFEKVCSHTKLSVQPEELFFTVN